MTDRRTDRGTDGRTGDSIIRAIAYNAVARKKLINEEVMSEGKLFNIDMNQRMERRDVQQ